MGLLLLLLVGRLKFSLLLLVLLLGRCLLHHLHLLLLLLLLLGCFLVEQWHTRQSTPYRRS